LGGALVALIHEKPFAKISVQDVLDRAQISRSTFYTHYSDTDDLFLSDAEDFFEMMAFHISRKDERSNRVAPVREMFAHIADVREFYAALVASGKLHDILELGQGYFARGIERRLNYFKPDLALTQRTALANAFAGAFMSLMSRWIHHGCRLLRSKWMSCIIARSGPGWALQLASSFRRRSPTWAQLLLQSERHNPLLRRLRLEGLTN
jgi:AcrR family transcriptional regulator